MRRNTLPGAEAWLAFSQAPTPTLFHIHRPSSAFYPYSMQASRSRVCPFLASKLQLQAWARAGHHSVSPEKSAFHSSRRKVLLLPQARLQARNELVPSRKSAAWVLEAALVTSRRGGRADPPAAAGFLVRSIRPSQLQSPPLQVINIFT